MCFVPVKAGAVVQTRLELGVRQNGGGVRQDDAVSE